jgi:L-lactate utilization protein LutB
MDYTKLASQESLERAVAGLKERGFEPVVVNTKEEALAKIKELIPAGASVMNGTSTTLQQVGYVDYLKAGQHPWRNLHANILAEQDPAAQKVLRRQALTSDYYLGSVHALAESGEMLIASNSGSQLPHIAYSSPNLVLVVSTKKIVPAFPDTYKRLNEHVVPMEDARMKQVNGPGSGTKLNKLFVFFGEPSYTGRKVTVMLVKEDLGF